ncbi:hypothetical protein B0H14DRAFT_3438502 [Mycena olivaceomarginata]|nr:hypothetical protein B0H14DRAFT_3438502 [Mycena olivaceomarginata]
MSNGTLVVRHACMPAIPLAITSAVESAMYERRVMGDQAPGSFCKGWSGKFLKSGLKKPLVPGVWVWKSHFLDKGELPGAWGIASGFAVYASVGVRVILLVMTRVVENDAYSAGALATVRAVDHSQ